MTGRAQRAPPCPTFLVSVLDGGLQFKKGGCILIPIQEFALERRFMPMCERGGFFICLVDLMAIGTLLAQTGAGRIEGTVKDASGAVIPNAIASSTTSETAPFPSTG
jgi:hypothetical protein